MAKIEWVFINEVVTNPNRYKAVNVSTGEEITFNLFRNGTITVVGTPLNAEKLNVLISAINGAYDDLETFKNSVNTSLSTKEDKSNLGGLAYKDNLSKGDVGLGNVDNTSDKDKPISNATQSALDLKEDKVNLKALAYKESVSQSDVGLGNVDNTSDADKPISTATKSALDLKANKSDLFSKSYDDLTNKPTIPTKVSELTNDSGFLTQHQDISGKANKSDIPTKVSQLTNDSGFLTQHQDISGKADKSEIPTKVSELTNDSGFTTVANIPTKVSQLTNDSGFLTNASIENKVDKSSLGNLAYKNSVSKSDVGLGNVDNTADASKSVKYATSSGSATSAGKATNDSLGNNISTTYQKKTWNEIWKGNAVSTNAINKTISGYNEILIIVDTNGDPATYLFPSKIMSDFSLYNGYRDKSVYLTASSSVISYIEAGSDVYVYIYGR